MFTGFATRLVKLMDRIEQTIRDLFSDHKKVGASEWAGPCPDCGGQDRHRVFEGQGNQGIFRTYCRQCNRSEDALQMAMEIRMLSFAHAHEYLGLPVPEFAKAEAGYEIANDRPLTREERRRIEWQVAINAQVSDTCHRLAMTMRAKGPGDDMYFQAGLTLMTERMAGCLAFLGKLYLEKPALYTKIARELEADGFPWWSFDVLGIDKEALDQVAVEQRG